MPEQNNQNPDQQQENNPETSTVNSGTSNSQNNQNTPASTQNTNTGPDLSLYRTVLSEYEQRNKQLMQELEAERNRTRTPVHDPAQATKEYFEDPVGVQRKLILDAVKEQIAPLVEFVAVQRQVSAYDNLKSQFRTLPNIAPYWSQIEANVDQLMQNTAPTVQNMNFAVSAAIGQLHLSGNFTPANVPGPLNNAPQNNNRQVNSPHIRPSPPASPANENQNNQGYRPLTENERRLMRENGFKNEKEYLDAIGAPIGNAMIVPTKTTVK